MAPPLPTLDWDSSCQEAIRLFREQAAQGIVVTGEQQHILGIVTSTDVVRKQGSHPADVLSVSDIMSSPVFLSQADDFLFHAISLMRKQGIRMLPVTGEVGDLIGTLHLSTALSAAMTSHLSLADELTRGDTLEELKAVKGAQIHLAGILLDEGVPVVEIQALLTQINNEFYVRILKILTEFMRLEGWGEVPVAYELIIMGSGGRGESSLFPDQDNGLILGQYDDRHHTVIDAYFYELSRRLSDILDNIGIPYCRGFVMATNPLWRKRLDQWIKQLEYWLRRPSPAVLRLSDIFFDFQPVQEACVLSERLRQYIVEKLPLTHRFLQEMQKVQEGHGVALGVFRQLTPDYDAGMHSGKLNLKYHGLLPLIESVRLLALREGIAATNTLERLAALHERGLLGDEAEGLCNAYSNITGLVLRQQLRDHASGLPVAAFIDSKDLAKHEEMLLIDELRVIAQFRAWVHSEFTAEI